MIERTTVRLPDDLLKRAKRMAAKEGRTVSSLIAHGLRLMPADHQASSTARQAGNLAEFFAGSPLKGSGLRIRRRNERPRKPD